MKAYLIATKEFDEVDILARRMPAVMLPLMDRPFIQHVVEYLADQGIVDFEIVLCHFPEKIKKLLGDGTRWGINITYHLVKSPLDAYRPLRFSKEQNIDILLGNADRLPVLNLAKNEKENPPHDATFFCMSSKKDAFDETYGQWLGWVQFSSRILEKFEEYSEKVISGLIQEREKFNINVERTDNYLSIGTCRELMFSQGNALEKVFPSLHSSAREIEPGIWFSRNVELQPDVKILPPVYIGENCRLIKECQVGPNAVIGENSVVNDGSVVEHSLVMPGTYIGEGLELSSSLADRNLLINFKIGSEIIVTDDFLLGSITDFQGFKKYIGFFSRVAALFGLVVTAPLLICLGFYYTLSGKRALYGKYEIVKLPAYEEPATWSNDVLVELWPPTEEKAGSKGEIRNRVPLGWKGFFTCFLPGLVNVVRGKLSVVGVKPRTRSELRDMPREHQSLILKSRSGLITNAMLTFGDDASDDEIYFADAEYVVSGSLAYDIKLLVKYVGLLFKGVLKFN